MKDSELLLLEVIPQWNRFIARAFKDTLPEGMSPPMHFLITQLRQPVSMSEMARVLRMSKQQMTKLADKVIEIGMAERINDPCDRRVILLKATPKASAYLENSEKQAREHFRSMLNEMGPVNEARFNESLKTLNDVFSQLRSPQRNKTGKEID